MSRQTVPPAGTRSASTSAAESTIGAPFRQNRGVSQPAFDLGLGDETEHTYSVGELANEVNGVLRDRFGDGVWVRGEIQGYSEKGQHAYFRLAESGDDGKAVLDVALFANIRMRLKPLLSKHRLRLGDGMKVRVFGSLDLYAPTGRLSLKMTGIDPRYTLGEMALERDDIVRRLVASGAYDNNRRRVLAAVPLRIGLVTSVDSAAWHDFTKELQRSGHGFTLRVVDVRVQGEFAAHMVTAAIGALCGRDDIDVIVVIRGGGSRSELAVFDAESIALVIAAAPVAVFTGIGHEIDRSVADEVAHSAFKTPTACAGALVERVNAFSLRAEAAWQELGSLAARQIEQSSSGLLETARRIEQRTITAVDRADQRLSDRAHRVELSCTRVLDTAELLMSASAQRIGRRSLQHTSQELQTLSQLEARVRLLDPAHTLSRGWSLTRTADGRVIRNALDVNVGDEIVTTFASGEARSRVEARSPQTPANDADDEGNQHE